MKGDYRLVQTVDGKQEVRFSGQFTSNVEVLLPEWKNLPSGAYELQLAAKDDQGRDVDYKQNIVLFSYDDNRPPVDSPVWFYARNAEFVPDILPNSVWGLLIRMLMSCWMYSAVKSV